MNMLRVLLSLLLCLSVPASALASVTQSGPCARMSAEGASPASSDAHAGHQMQGMDHSQHMLHAGAAKAEENAKTSLGCACGCDCTSHHCFSGASGLLTGLATAVAFAEGDDQHPHTGAARTASAHHLEILRPPSLT